MIDSSKCPLCGSGPLRVLKEYHFARPAGDAGAGPAGDPSYTAERLQVFFEYIWPVGADASLRATLCRECGFIFTNPRLERTDVECKYTELGRLPSVRARASKSPPRRTDERAERIRALVSQAVPLHGASVLDYGGSQGHNLLGFLETSRCFLADYVRSDLVDGVEYLGRDMTDIPADRSFDVVLACHVVEHDPEPVELLLSLAGLLSEGGAIYLEVPLGAFREWRTLAEPLTHVNFFSEQSAARLAALSGLDTVHLSSDWQWVTHSESWCVNLVARKAGSGSRPVPVAARRTTSQMRDPRYYYRPVRRKIARVLGAHGDVEGERE